MVSANNATTQSVSQDLGLVVGVIRSAVPPTENTVIWFNTVDSKHYTYDVSSLTWVIIESGGSGGKLKNDINVSLTNGKTMGAIKDGEFIAKGTNYEDLFVRALIEVKYPSYSPATLYLSQSASQDGEIGEVVNNTLTATFARNDAGVLTSLSIRVDGTIIDSAGIAPQTIRSASVTRNVVPHIYKAYANYDSGTAKLVPPANVIDGRAAAIRTNNAPQAAENNFESNSVVLYGYNRIFFGPTAAAPNNATGIRNLSESQLTNQGNQFILNTGNAQKTFCFWLPVGKTLLNVTDLDNLNANLTSAYTATVLPSVNAGGVAVNGTLYTLSAQVPYGTSVRHQVTYA